MQDVGIDELMIERQVHGFYAAARHDPLIGPIFEAKIADWDRHLARMCAFWSSVALMSGHYSGTPMQAHAPLPIADEHFERWLELWTATARAQCPPAAAERFSLLARRIAQSLSHGVAVHRGELPERRLDTTEVAHV
jgi:hemoglobin